jgi:hypothetical protein
VGADVPSAYFFRGYKQESDAAFTFQPFVDVGVAANDKVKFNFGSWNSIHSGSLADREDVGLEGRMAPQPLQTGEHGGQFIATGEGEHDVLDGDGLEFGLGGEAVAHSGRLSWWRRGRL